jgi:hypothetical protein
MFKHKIIFFLILVLFFDTNSKENSFPTSHKTHKFIPIESIRIGLFNRLNEIDSISIIHDRNNFYSVDGVISFNKSRNVWEIDSTNNHSLQRNNEKNISQDVPREFKLRAYCNVKDRVKKYGYEIVLMGLASEGCYSWSAVFDTSRNKIFNGLDALYRSLDYDKDNIWLGQKYGFSKINRNTNFKQDYLLLPIYDKNSSIKIFDDYIFLAINSLGIQKIDLVSDSITFWNYDDILSLYPNVKKRIIYDGYPYFSNFCKVDSLIFVGCRILQDYWMGYTRNKGSLLFIYSIKNSTWDVKYLEEFDAVRILSYHDDKIWFGGNQLEISEGDAPFLHGGVGYYNLVSKEIEFIESIPKNKLVLDFQHNNGNTFVRVYANKEIFTYKIFKDFLATKVDSLVFLNYNDFNNYTNNIINTISKIDSIKYSSKLNQIQIRPCIFKSDNVLIERVEKYKR